MQENSKMFSSAQLGEIMRLNCSIEDFLESFSSLFWELVYCSELYFRRDFLVENGICNQRRLHLACALHLIGRRRRSRRAQATPMSRPSPLEALPVEIFESIVAEVNFPSLPKLLSTSRRTGHISTFTPEKHTDDV